MKNNIEDKFFGKRIVKEIFAKSKFAHKNLSALIAKAKQLGIEYAKEGYGSPSAGDSRWQKLHSELLAGGGGSQYSPENVQAEKEMLNAFMEANKKERSRLGFSRTGGKAKFAEQQWGSYEDKELSDYTKRSTVLMEKIETKLKELQDYRRELRSATVQLEGAKRDGNTHFLEQLKSRIDRCDKARQSFSRTGGKVRFSDMGNMDKEGRATWSKLESQIRKYEDELRVFSKDGNFKSASFACTNLKSLYESLSALYLKASKNVSPKSSPYFSKKKFGFEKDVINVLEEANIDTSEIQFVNGKIRIPKNLYVQAKEALLNSSSITSLPKFEQFSRTGEKKKF